MFRTIGRIIIYSIWVALFLMFAPGIPPYDVEFESIPYTPMPKFEGPLKPNKDLENIEYLSNQVDGSSLGYLKGAESFEYKDGYLYSGLQGGDIIRLDIMKDDSESLKDATWQKVGKIGKPCSSIIHEDDCGRPLGLAFDNYGYLLVADAYYGLYSFNVHTGRSQPLVPHTVEIDGRKNQVTNAVVVTKKENKNDVYFTGSSTRFDLTNALYEIATSGSGRVYKYDPKKNVSEVLMDNLSFPNGLILSPKEDYLLILESGRQRIWKYHLVGKKKGQSEIYADMPGVPDNITPNGDNGYFVGIIFPLTSKLDDVIKQLRSFHPIVRLLVRLLKLIHLLIEFIHDYLFQTEMTEMLVHHIGHSEFMGPNVNPNIQGLIVEIDSSGKIVRSWQSPSGKVSRICEAFLHNGYMYLGSPFNTYVGRIHYNSAKFSF